MVYDFFGAVPVAKGLIGRVKGDRRPQLRQDIRPVRFRQLDELRPGPDDRTDFFIYSTSIFSRFPMPLHTFLQSNTGTPQEQTIS